MSGAYRSADATVSARKAVAITKSDSTVIPVTRAIYIGVGGTIKVRMAEDQALVTFVNVAPGIFPIQVDQVYSAVTTCTDMVALY
jgi:hypothetical protein